MTELLQRAIAELSKLSDEDQDAMASDRSLTIATRLLAELEDEQAWQNRFDATTDNQWDNLAALVRQEIASGSYKHVRPT
jgi:hypothetical protein